jgi:hypothetical protein
MVNSQKSFETLFGRFQNGDIFVQAIAAFDPKNALIKKTNLTTFISDLAIKDKAVTENLDAWKSAVAMRKPLAFKQRDCDENCMESRIRNIYAYIGADIGKNSGAYKIIGGYLKKIAPTYEKKDPTKPRGVGKSPSEKSFVALNGYATQTLKLITDLGADYAPQNTNIQVTNFQTFADDMIDKTKNIAKLESDYSDSVRVRLEAYNGAEGVLERQKLIKGYLASFTGGKKSQNYVEYDRLIKGN